MGDSDYRSPEDLVDVVEGFGEGSLEMEILLEVEGAAEGRGDF